MVKGLLNIGVVVAGCLAAVQSSYAVGLSTENTWRFGVNGYIDTQYTVVEQAPVVEGTVGSPPTLANSHEVSNLSQEHLNLIFTAEKDALSVVINLDSHPLASQVHAGGSTDNMRLAEAYGKISFGNNWSLQTGQFNAPFSMFNHVAYALPLFASVHLPLMYLTPSGYHGGTNGIDDSASVRHNLMPAQANIMLSKSVETASSEWNFDLYLSAGARSHDNPTMDANADKGVGGRIKVSGEDDAYVLGVSAYTVNNAGAGEFPSTENTGRENLIGADALVNFLDDQFKIELELVYDQFASRKNRWASSLRLSNNFSDTMLGFISHQYMQDDAHPIMLRGMHVYTLGGSYSWDTSVMFKAEYHLHSFNDSSTALALPNDNNQYSMYKASVSFMF